MAATSNAARSSSLGQIVPMLGLAGLAFAVIAWLSLQNLPYGVSALGAERVLNGEIPYRDFWTIYAPGQFYLLAVLFAVFGHDGSVSAVAGSLLNAAAIGLTFRLIWCITGRQVYAFACSALFLGAFLSRGYYGAVSSYAGVIFFLLVALNFLELFLDRGRTSYLIAAGLAAGVGAWFKHDVAAYSTIAMLAGLATYYLAASAEARLTTAFSNLLVLGFTAAGAILPVLLTVALLAGADAFQDLIVFPATIFPLGRPEAYPSLIPTSLYDDWLLQHLLNWARYLYFALPLLLFLVCLPMIAITLHGRQAKLAGFGVAFAVLFLFHFSAAHVQINTHIISMTLYAACLSAVALQRLSASLRPRPRAWIGGLAVIIAAGWFGTLAAQPFYDRVGRALLTGRQVERVALSLPKVSQARIAAKDAANLTALVSFVQEQVPPDEPIYVGPHRHDVVVIGWPGIYFMLDRPPATRYDEMEPGITDTAPVQAEMVRDLIDKDVRLIVLAKVFKDADLDKKKEIKQRNLPQIGATLLDDFIRSNYVEARQFGRFSVWLRKTP